MPIDSAYRFWRLVDAHYGAYLDAAEGFRLVLRRFYDGEDRLDAMHRQNYPRVPLPDRGNTSIAYANPEAYPTERYLHNCPSAQYIRRNTHGGENFVLLGRMFLVMVYQLWDSEFRAAIATELGLSREEVTVPIMGDIRLIRNAILHNAARADRSCERIQVLRFWSLGEEIAPDNHQIDIVAREILAFVHRSHGVSDVIAPAL
jgi:hypothetical protein